MLASHVIKFNNECDFFFWSTNVQLFTDDLHLRSSAHYCQNGNAHSVRQKQFDPSSRHYKLSYSPLTKESGRPLLRP